MNKEYTESPLNEPIPQPYEVTLEGKKFTFKKYEIGEPVEAHNISPGLMQTPDQQTDFNRIYEADPSLLKKRFPKTAVVPYAFLGQEQDKILGDYTARGGQREFGDADLALTDQAFNPPDWTSELWRFSALKHQKKFTLDKEMACLRGLENKSGKQVFTIGPGLYSQSFYSNGAEGTAISLTSQDKQKLTAILSPNQMDELEHLAEKLQKQYGQSKTIQEIIADKYPQLPAFGEQIHNNSIGVAGMVLTEKDGQFVFVNRGHAVSVNQGINCTASGAAEFDKETLSQHGLQHFLGGEMARETGAELGFKAGSLLIAGMRQRIKLELGLSEEDYELIPVGMIRELPRGGKPECMFIIKYKGSATNVIKSIINNPNEEKVEIAGSVYTLSQEETSDLIKNSSAGSLIQHKGLANLILSVEYLKNH